MAPLSTGPRTRGPEDPGDLGLSTVGIRPKSLSGSGILKPLRNYQNSLRRWFSPSLTLQYRFFKCLWVVGGFDIRYTHPPRPPHTLGELTALC